MASTVKDLEKKVDDTLTDIKAIFGQVNINSIPLTDITLRIGGRVVKFTKSSDEDLPVDKEIKAEYQNKISAKMKEIYEVINNKLNEALRFAQSVQSEFTRQEQILKDRLAKAHPMPEVKMSHARRGLSVFKGETSGEICWLVRRTYWPKFVDHVAIEPSYIEPFITPIFILITTKDNQITRVETRRLAGLELFNHYHQANPDCWGKWSNYKKKFSSPDEIIAVADEAEAVLENINSGSIANREPHGLPKFETLKRHVTKEKSALEDIKVTDGLARAGVRTVGGAEDVWSAR